MPGLTPSTPLDAGSEQSGDLPIPGTPTYGHPSLHAGTVGQRQETGEGRAAGLGEGCECQAEGSARNRAALVGRGGTPNGRASSLRGRGSCLPGRQLPLAGRRAGLIAATLGQPRATLCPPPKFFIGRMRRCQGACCRPCSRPPVAGRIIRKIGVFLIKSEPNAIARPPARRSPFSILSMSR